VEVEGVIVKIGNRRPVAVDISISVRVPDNMVVSVPT
jgi:hypothetical protein